MLHRYHNIEFVLQTDLDTGLQLISKAIEKDRDDRIFQQWVAQLPMMGMTGTVVSFADYKDRVTGANIDRRPVAQIMVELDEVENRIKELREGVQPSGS